MPAEMDPNFEKLAGRRPLALPPGPHDLVPATVEHDVQLRDCFRALYRRRRLVLSIFLLCVVAGMVYAFSATPVFEARTNLVIEPETPRIGTFTDFTGLEGAKPDYYQTQFEILRSRTLAKRTLDSLQLWNHPELAPTGAETPWARVRQYLDRFLMPRASAATAVAGETLEQSHTIDAFLSRLSVTPRTASRIVDLAWRSTDPELAAKVVNALAETYVAHNLEFRFAASKEASNWLRQRLEEQRQRVEASEGALQRYREENNLIDSQDRQNIVYQKLADLTAAVTRARTERIQKQAVYQQLKAIEGKEGGVDALPAAFGNQYIQQLKSELTTLQRQEVQASERLGREHPEMLKLRAAIQMAEQKLANELNMVVQSAGNDYLAARAQERSLEAAVQEQKTASLDNSRATIQYDILRRNAESDRQIFESLLQSTKETGISGELRASNIHVLDAAENPLAPVWPMKRLILIVSAFLGLLVAGFAAVVAEYRDDRVKTADEIRLHLGLKPLGLVPELPEPVTAIPSDLASRETRTQFGESFRFVRANALFSSTGGNRSFLVTSAGPGEGKTIVASNLAIALSQAGDRVLLVDADMRSPQIHEIFGQPRNPGLSDLLTGSSARAADVLHRVGTSNLWIMAAGSVTDHPADLLGSRRFKDLFKAMGESFDWVVIDSPPVMAVADACLVARAGVEVLFVLGADRNSRRAARAALEQLEVAGVHVAGAVLNRANLDDETVLYSSYYAPSQA